MFIEVYNTVQLVDGSEVDPVRIPLDLSTRSGVI